MTAYGSVIKDLKEIKAWIISFLSTVFSLSLVIVSLLMYDWAEIEILLYFGWSLLIIGLILFISTNIFSRVEEQSDDEIVLDRGIYGFIRQPIYFSLVTCIIGIAFIGQNPLSPVLGIVSILLMHLGMLDKEQQNYEKFGENYYQYVKKVPRINVITGMIRWVRSHKGHSAAPPEYPPY